MKPKRYHVLFFLFSLPLLLLLVFSPSGDINAALPPRPTVEPTKPKPQPGASIQLQLSGAPLGPQGVWTIVQWGDAFGKWHDVTGWQGTVELDGTQTWWVAPEDMGSGPFRWRVLSSKAGSELAVSASFMLPDQARQVLAVPVQVE